MRSSKRARRNNRAGMLSISFVIVVMAITLTVKCKNLELKTDTYSQRIQVLEQEKETEIARKEELEEYSKYVKTKKYVEEVAKDKLGLVYPDEIIFKAQE